MPARVIKEGYGSWTEVMGMPSDEVMQAFHYSIFLTEYQDTVSELNREPNP